MAAVESSQKNILDLINTAAEGSHEAFEQLLLLQNKIICYKIRTKISNREDVEDIAQEVALRIFMRIDSLKNPEYFGSWLNTMIVRECLKHFNSNNHMTYLEDLSETEDFETLLVENDTDCLPEECLEKREAQNELKRAVDKFSTNVRKMLHLHYNDGLKYREIADIMNMPVGTVCTHLFRTKKRLLKEFSSTSSGIL